MDINILKPVLNKLSSTFLNDAGIELSVLRLDSIHPIISGNKWFKLKENIKIAKQLNKKAILSFGGAYSNHLHALAAIAKELNLASIGIIRGKEIENSLSPTLEECKKLGMTFHFISRQDYHKKDDVDSLKKWEELFPNAYIIPEGGNNELGKLGAQEISEYIPKCMDLACVSIGTGTTFMGIRESLNEEIELLGFPALKQAENIETGIIKNFPKKNWHLIKDYHFNGFAKWDAELIEFMIDFYHEFQIPLDIVYTGKMMFGIFDLIDKGYFPKKSKILMIHSGGLQGNRGVPKLAELSIKAS